VRIDLNDHTDALKTLKKEQIGTEKAIEFVSEKILKLEPGLEAELFKHCCEQKQKVDIVIMLDGFDEISPSYKQTVTALLQALRQTAVEQLWVTTRPHLRKELEDELQQLSYTLEPFSEENQVEFLTKFWSLNKWYTEIHSKGKEEKKVKLANYAKHLIKKIAQSISDKDKQFTGIPFQCRMLAEAFDKEVKTFCQSAATVPELTFSLDLFGLYETFMKRKYDIFVEEKFKIPESNVGAELARTRLLAPITQDHQILALKTLFGEEQVALLQINKQCTSTDEDLTRIGILHVSDDGKPHFIHRTFAEYYAADYFVKQLTKRSNTSKQVQDLLLEKIFLEGDYRVIRVFIDRLLSRCNPSQEVLKQYGNRISDLCGYGTLTLHQSALEGNANIVGFLLESLQAGEHTDIVHDLLLAQGDDGDSAWKVAARGRERLLLRRLCQKGKETLTADELRNKYLLAKENKGMTAWQYASWQSNFEALQKLWEWGKKTLSAEELSNKLLLAKDEWGQTAWHLAAKKGNIEILEELWEWGKGTLTAEELSNKLLLAIDKWGKSAWHYVSQGYNAEALQKLWEWGKETLTAEELSNKWLLAKNKWGQTAWNLAAKKGNIEILQKLWECGKETLTAEELSNKLLLAKDNEERTAWHYASQWDNVELLHYMWEWGKETLTAEDLSNKWLLAKDNMQQTAWHLAAKQANTAVLEKLCDLAKEAKINVKHELCLAKNNEGKTVLVIVQENRLITDSEKLKAIELIKNCF
jgi:ankyrin repeat protein